MNGIAKPSAKIYITISATQVTHIQITHVIHQLLNFDHCGLVDPVVYVVVVQAQALHSDPVPILHVYQHLLPHVQAVCFIRADIYTQVVYLHA